MALKQGKNKARAFGLIPGLLVMAALCLALFPGKAHAAWVLQGNALMNGSVVELTQPAGDLTGAAWFDSQIDLARDFDVTYTMRFSSGANDGGADGITFMLHRDSRGSSAVGDSLDGGQWVGEHSIRPGIGIEMDTYQNTVQGDPAADHIGVNEFIATGTPYAPNHNGAAAVNARADGANIEDGATHSFRVVWTASTRTMLIYFDGSLRITYNRDFITNLLGGNTVVWWGFVASTGGMVNLQSMLPSTPTVSVVKPVSPTSIPATGNVTYEIRITNNGTSTIWVSQVTDTMPAGFTYVNGSTTGITTANPGISGQVLTWNMNGYSVQPGTTQSLFFQNTAPVTAGNYCNTFTVSGPNFPMQSGSCQTQLTVRPIADLSIEKNHVDYFTVGNTESYEIVVTNNGPHDAAAPVVTDTIPTGLTYQSSTGSGWTVNTSALPTVTWTWSGPATAGATLPPITVSVLVGATAVPSVTNTASAASTTDDLVPANNSDSDPTTVIGAGSGNKPLYLAAGNALSRAPNTTAPGATTLTKGGGTASWTLPATTGSLTLTAGTIPVYLYLSSNAAANRTMTVTLRTTGGTVLNIGTLGPTSYALTTTPTVRAFNFTLGSNQTLAPGTQFVLTVTNNTTGTGTRNVIVTPNTGLTGSRVALTASNVITISAIGAYNAAYSGGTTPGWFSPGSTVYVRATAADPFGSSDITGAYVDIVDANNNTRVSNASMTIVATNAAAGTRTYEYAYVLPASPEGTWTARVRTWEGFEGTVNDVEIVTFDMGLPHLVVAKTSYVASDPTGGANPKAIPGALVAYTITVTNTGYGGADTGTVSITDPIPANTGLYVDDIGGSPSGPVSFTGPGSGLALSFSGLSSDTDDLDFQGPGGWGYHPSIDPASGCDDNVTGLLINPKGVFNPSSSFQVRFMVRVD
ncbi:MAG: DUF11 domain-containing protein [Deltaproteobacteria bacterium]|nr:DUF11 domain-containing protein [Deltaproteobacteria bacterium]